MHAATEDIIPFVTDDGRTCNLIHVHGRHAPSKGPVLLVHGAGVRANIFRPPVAVSFVDALLEVGYDVWLENWRASIDLAPNPWTLDQAAVYDHPRAVSTILQHTGARSIKAVVHCQGSTSFVMSAVAGLLPQVDTIVSNAVSLHPRVSFPARLKSMLAVPLVSRMTDYLNPQWGESATGLVPRMLQALVKLTHHECDNAVCRFSSFTYGYGFPVLWRHENLNAATHDWLRQEFGAVPMTFFRQMACCLAAGALLPSGERLPGIPADLLAGTARTDARFVFVAGEQNNCFHWQSQQQSFDWFDRQRPNYHSLHVLSGYGHLDVFMGQHAARDTFPILLGALDH